MDYARSRYDGGIVRPEPWHVDWIHQGRPLTKLQRRHVGLARTCSWMLRRDERLPGPIRRITDYFEVNTIATRFRHPIPSTQSPPQNYRHPTNDIQPEAPSKMAGLCHRVCARWNRYTLYLRGACA